MKTDFPLKEFGACPTPFYFYDMKLLDRTLDAIIKEKGDFHVHYALKANSNPEIVSHIAARGFGADCVSGGEIQRALDCGVPANKIVFAGVGKTDAEINLALRVGIGCFNVESAEEMQVISALAVKAGTVARIAIRVNPNIDAHTHANITTGLAENKFGINFEMLPATVNLAHSLPGVELTGLHFHIGSQILDNEPFERLCHVINRLQTQVRVNHINVGGGLGIDYVAPDEHPIPDFGSYFDVFRRNLNLMPGQTLHFELGRSIVAQCGSLISRVVYIKHGTAKNFLICDAGMSELIRPALYQARHKIENLSEPADAPIEKYDVVGPVCESSDVFGTDELLPVSCRGDLIAFRSAGAYGETMASNYNLRHLETPFYLEK